MKTNTNSSDAWIDAWKYGWTGRSEGFFNEEDRNVAMAIQHIGRITTPASRAHDGYEQMTIDLETDGDHPAGSLRIEVHARRDGNDLIFGDRCSVSGNGMSTMRGFLGSHDCGELGYDDRDNVLGRQHRVLSPLEAQLPIILEAVQHAMDALDSAFPGWQPGELWLKGAEACRDLDSKDAIGDVRVVQHAALCGATERRLDLYRRIAHAEVTRVPTIRYLELARGPEDKVYAKRNDTVRLEVSCRGRDTIASLVGRDRSSFCLEGAKVLLLNFLHNAAARLDRLEQHVRAALAGEETITSLLIHLKPLIDRAAGTVRSKGPPSGTAEQMAKQALEALLSVGMFDAGGSHARHAIRRELEALTDVAGPLERHSSRARYYLKARFARACGALRLSE